PTTSSAPVPTTRRRWTLVPAARPSTTRSCTSSRWPCRTRAGTTSTPTTPSAPADPTPSNSGTRSRRPRPRSGPAATTRSTRTRRPSGAAWRASSRTVRCWSARSPSPRPTRRYHSIDPNEMAFGGRVELEFEDGSTLVDEIAVADAHPLGARPFARANYVEKFKTLAEGIVSDSEQARFLDLAENLESL